MRPARRPCAAAERRAARNTALARLPCRPPERTDFVFVIRELPPLLRAGSAAPPGFGQNRARTHPPRRWKPGQPDMEVQEGARPLPGKRQDLTNDPARPEVTLTVIGQFPTPALQSSLNPWCSSQSSGAERAVGQFGVVLLSRRAVVRFRFTQNGQTMSLHPLTSRDATAAFRGTELKAEPSRSGMLVTGSRETLGCPRRADSAGVAAENQPGSDCLKLGCRFKGSSAATRSRWRGTVGTRHEHSDARPDSPPGRIATPLDVARPGPLAPER